MKYIDEVNKGMALLAEHPKTLFIGQAMEYLGHAITKQVMQFPTEKRFEFVVSEDFQAGFCLGMALEGYIPINIFPRFDFAILACNQLFNHIDRWSLIVPDGNLHIITKICSGATKPLFPGHQHCADYSEAFKLMSKTTKVYNLLKPEDIVPAYEEALNNQQPSIIIEHGNLY